MVATVSERDDGGPAHPCVVPNDSLGAEQARGLGGFVPKATVHLGLSLRDYFAAQALSGFCMNPDGAIMDGPHTFDSVAGEAYQMADAMLKARKL